MKSVNMSWLSICPELDVPDGVMRLWLWWESDQQGTAHTHCKYQVTAGIEPTISFKEHEISIVNDLHLSLT